MIYFDRLDSRYVLKCTLHSDEALHVGTGVSGTNTDAPVITMNGKPFLPGSSLRGVLRATAERLLDTLWRDQQCLSFAKPIPNCDSGVDKPEVLEQKIKDNKATFCDMCQFFGSTNLAARFKVGDATQTAARQPIRRDGVGIDRDTETARDQIKYDFEVLEPGVDFSFTMQIENATLSDKAILYLLLCELKNGIDVGGKRARGLGRVRLSDVSVEYFDQAGDSGHKLRDYLLSGNLAPKPAGQFDAELKQAFAQYRRAKEQ